MPQPRSTGLNLSCDGPNRCLHCTKVRHKTHPICDHQHRAASLRHRNRAATTVLMCEQKPNQVCRRRKSSPVMERRRRKEESCAIPLSPPCRTYLSAPIFYFYHSMQSFLPLDWPRAYHVTCK